MSVQPRTIRNYLTTSGKEPFEEWLQTLRDTKARALIRLRINRLRLGNFGDAKALGQGVYELRVHYGPGYRVFFADADGIIVVLLCGGDKRTQRRDVQRAKAYWQELRGRHHE